MQRIDFLTLDSTVPQEEDPLAVMLKFAWFLNPQANRIREDGFDTVEDMGVEMLEEENITELAATFSRLPVSSHISFGIARSKRLNGMIHWAQCHNRVSLSVSFPTGST